MSENETSLEDKLFVITFLICIFCFGYWTRGDFGIFGDFWNIGISITLIDGLMRIIGIGSGVLALIGMVLMHFDKKED